LGVQIKRESVQVKSQSVQTFCDSVQTFLDSVELKCSVDESEPDDFKQITFI